MVFYTRTNMSNFMHNFEYLSGIVSINNKYFDLYE